MTKALNISLAVWAEKHDIELVFIQLATHNKMPILSDAIAQWGMIGLAIICLKASLRPRVGCEYSNERPNMALGGITPKQKLALAAYPIYFWV